ncbi:LytR/AlgR family response regulator transcription factor [Flagellimonas sp.]|uniref:LytR/AlgR family response regulator transcription factor n=1 Tax=Flagellimonas sp. TaxID=2058762 RepID=UPI003B504674
MKNFTEALKHRIPYLDSIRNRFVLIGFVSLFSLIFLLVYLPFNMDELDTGQIYEYILYGTGVLIVTQFGVRKLIRLNHLKLFSLVLFAFFEILLISYIFHLLYGPALGTSSEKWNDFIITIRQVGPVMVVPYILILAYFWTNEKVNKVAELENKFVVPQKENSKMLVIKGENDKIELAIKYEQLLCIKSAGNYLEIFYLSGDQVVKTLVRGSLKEMENNINDASMVRVHRSHMINITHISSAKKTKKGYTITVNHLPTETFAVSSGYKDDFNIHLS